MPARHRLVLDHHARLDAAPEHQLRAIIELHHARIALVVERDDQVPRPAALPIDDRIQPGRPIELVTHDGSL
jgi:hypothetical protein